MGSIPAARPGGRLLVSVTGMSRQARAKSSPGTDGGGDRRELAQALPTVFADQLARSPGIRTAILSGLGLDAEPQTSRDEPRPRATRHDYL